MFSESRARIVRIRLCNAGDRFLFQNITNCVQPAMSGIELVCAVLLLVDPGRCQLPVQADRFGQFIEICERNLFIER